MPAQMAKSAWRGTLKDGKGLIRLGSGLLETEYTFQSRFEGGPGTNPEELLSGALSACFSMSLAFGLEQAGYVPKRVETAAKVNLATIGGISKIISIELYTQGEVPGVEERIFQHHAENAKKNCPVSLALASTQILLEANLTTQT